MAEQQVTFLRMLLCSALIGATTGAIFECLMSIAAGDVLTSAITGGIAPFTFGYFRTLFDDQNAERKVISYLITGAIVAFKLGTFFPRQTQYG